jgi:hypothetical protein
MSARPESARTESPLPANAKPKHAVASQTAAAIPHVSASHLLETIPTMASVARMLYAVVSPRALMTLIVRGGIARVISVRLRPVVALHLRLSQVFVLRAYVEILLRI